MGKPFKYVPNQLFSLIFRLTLILRSRSWSQTVSRCGKDNYGALEVKTAFLGHDLDLTFDLQMTLMCKVKVTTQGQGSDTLEMQICGSGVLRPFSCHDPETEIRPSGNLDLGSRPQTQGHGQRLYPTLEKAILWLWG